ncbi:MAG: hypothetical protein ACYCYR_15330, partial [Desulfobulbaceae bacterium]
FSLYLLCFSQTQYTRMQRAFLLKSQLFQDVNAYFSTSQKVELIKSLFTVTPSAVGMGKVWGDPIVRPGKIALWDLPLKLKKN